MHAMRQRRRELGLSQAEVAAAAGLSRQLVSAVEGGRNVPSVTAALALATALQSDVGALFGDERPPIWEPVLGQLADPGTAVMAARVGDRGVYHPLPYAGASPEGWRRSDGIVTSEGVDAFDARALQGVVVAGCDPVLRLVSEILPEEGPRRLLAVPATSVEAARALHRDRAHAAVVHGTQARLQTPTPRARAFPIARWRVGVAAPRGKPLDLESVATGRTSIAYRPVGAEAQKALARALADLGGVADLNGKVAPGHLEAARLAHEGAVAAALTMEPAANAYELDFLPLEEHTVELRIDERWTDLPGIETTLEIFGSDVLRRRLATLGGYELLAP